MKRTSKYQLAYYEEQDYTSTVPEMQRWETLDAQLYGLYRVIGNGIIDGWNILPSEGLAVTITAGSGNVGFVSVASGPDTLLPGLTPSTRNYIYASITIDSYWSQTVTFTAYNSTNPMDTNLYLGYVDTNATSVTGINTDGRTNLGFLALVKQVVSEHRHIGGTGNPQPVDLSSDVQGIISQDNLPDMDASIIQTGTLDPARLPKIDHITKLINQGTLTHAQLDSFVEMLSLEKPSVMGEVSTINLLQLILAVKHIYPDIDEFFVNEIAFIPGISPDSYIDTVNTTATVDTRPWSEGGQHTITGAASAGKQAYTKTWDTATEFGSDTYSQVTIDDDNVTLATVENTLVIDDFYPIEGWTVTTDDLSSITTGLEPDPTEHVIPIAVQSGKLTIGNKEVEIALTLKKTFNAMDWSGYKYVVFYLKTDSVEHGDVYFFLNDTIAGSQNTYTKVLSRNSPTINVDTLQNGWQEVRIDITSYTRTSIDSLGFFVSTQNGWDTSKGFSLNIDDIFLTSGNLYKSNGYVRVIYGNDNFPYEFWRVRWDAIIPTDSQSVGLLLKSRTRVANTLAGLATASWSPYTSVSGDTIPIPVGMLYKFIEIETFFGASTTLTRSAILKRLYLDYYAVDTEGSFDYSTKDTWDSGSKFNIDTQTVPNSMLISKTGEVNDIYYGANTHAVQIDSNMDVLYDVTGSVLPRSTYQVINNLSPSLGLVTGVSRGSDGTMWVSDLDNDRIMEMDKSGALAVGYFGSFLTPPKDPYGKEDAGPGSNTNVVVSGTTTSTTTSLGQTISALHSIYNPSTGTLYIVFDSDLENIYDPASTMNLTNMYLRIGSQRFNFNDATVTLLGVDETKYNDWKQLGIALAGTGSSIAQLVNQFGFTSHVLKVVLNGADQSLLNHMVSPGAPSIVILDPYNQQRVGADSTVNFLLYNFELGVSGAENRIRVTLNNSLVQDVYNTSISYAGLSGGVYTLKAQLVNADGSLNTNIEAIAEGTFVVYPTECIEPYLTITTPRANQIYSSSPVTINFAVENFPIVPSGQHLRYVVDTEAPVDYYSISPIVLEDLLPGKHTISMYLVDVSGGSLGYTYGQVSGTFIVGLNSNATVKLYVDSESISSSNNVPAGNSRVYVDVANVTFSNIYSPIDVQIIPAETSSVNPQGLPTVLIAKLRSPSWTDGLGSTADAVELARRSNVAFNANGAGTTTTTTATFIAATTTTTSTISPAILAITTPNLVYSTKYLDGHSVVQIDMDGNILLSNNAAVFADSKENAKVLLGSAEKLGDNEILIGDAINKRAIIASINLDTQIPQIEWQYDSDRYVSDFHIVTQNPIVITIRDDGIDNSVLYVKQGSTVIWVNNSSKPISIYSGKTTYDDFQADPDLNLYGQEFYSPVLQPGERYAFKFLNAEDYDWFVYPDILTGVVHVGKNRIASTDQFIILENDALESPFSSRAIRVDSWGNVIWSFGEGYLVKPRDARPMLSDSFSDYVLIST